MLALATLAPLMVIVVAARVLCSATLTITGAATAQRSLGLHMMVKVVVAAAMSPLLPLSLLHMMRASLIIMYLPMALGLAVCEAL